MTGAPIFIGFAALAALLCWLLIYARGHWAVKAATTVVVLAFSFAVWHALGTYQGWPADLRPPDHTVFVHGIVINPDPVQGTPGTIYLWLIPTGKEHAVLGHHNSFNEPRAYRVPYSDAAAQAVQNAEALQKRGAVVGFDHRKGGKGRVGSGGQRIPKDAFRAYALPATRPPRKGGS